MTGKIVPARMPPFRFSPKASDTRPIRAGPPVQPRSPARASRANRAVPPPLSLAAARLKVPGHKIPTESPQSPQPAKETAGQGERAARP